MRFLSMLSENVSANISVSDGAILNFYFVMILGMYCAMILATLAIVIVTIVATWRIFTKAGIPGWLSLVPIYNTYVMYKRFWSVGAFKRLVAWYVLSWILSMVTELVPFSNAVYLVLIIASIVLSLCCLINTLGLHWRLAKSFDRGFGFALGLTFLTPFFHWILGLGDCDYVGDVYDYYY